ncbi:MAG: DUF4160 domain-containing protein [Clostridia bacterium]|nr:DUF4160 domain-containing protein [Clostridia bacterium]
MEWKKFLKPKELYHAAWLNARLFNLPGLQNLRQTKEEREVKHCIMRNGALEISMYSLDLDHCFPFLYVSFKRKLKSRVMDAVYDVDGKILEGHLPTVVKRRVKKWIAANRGFILIMWSGQTFYEIT